MDIEESDLLSRKFMMESKKKEKGRKTSLFFGSSGGILTDRFSPESSGEFSFGRRRDNLFTDVTSSPTSRPLTSSTNIDVIPTIPDLDDLESTLANETSADAPIVSVNKLSSYQDLEKDILKLSAFSSFQASEFSSVLKKILSETETNETSTLWTMDILITSIANKSQDVTI